MQGLTRACYGKIIAVGSPECQCVCAYERERERERECVCTCVCVCVCEVVRWKGRGCKCWSSMGKTLAITSRQPRLYANTQHGCGSGDTALSSVDLELRPETEKRIPANQDLTDCLPKLFKLSIVAVSVNEIKKNFGDFSKKRKVIFQKAESKKKKRNSAEKRKIDIPAVYYMKKWRQRHPNYNQSDSLHELNRPEQVILFRLRTGHNRLNAHMYNKFKAGESEMCPCNADIMTAEHLLQHVDCMML